MRYIMANRRAGMFKETEKTASRRALNSSFKSLFASSVEVIEDHAPKDQKARRVVVFEADPAEAQAKSKDLPPDVLLEPAIAHYVHLYAPADLLGARVAAQPSPPPAGRGLKLALTITGQNKPLEEALVILYLRGSFQMITEIKAVTGKNGKVTFDYSPFWRPAAAVVVPAGGFWSFIVRKPGDGTTVDLPALPEADKNLGWWHEVLRVDHFQKSRGKDIKVGVIDTGCGPHPCLSHVTDAGAFINGDVQPGQGADVDSHGSHVCGIIGAIPLSAGQYGGLAPGADLFIGRVFSGPDSGADQGDIVNAIDELSRNRQVDLINMSLGAKRASQIEQDAIQDALERGTLCICAAGNSDGPVEYPGAFPQVVGVSALGLEGWGPAGSLAASRLPEDADRFGSDHLYLGNFSCFGKEIACAGPGVGIISTVPARGLKAPYAAMDGTSMASPAVCGTLAAILSGSGEYKALPHDLTRAQMARQLLVASCRSIGLNATFQGVGVAKIS